jgi:UDP-N-acetylglucosamine:LPS N-acetylglucosamine transferase
MIKACERRLREERINVNITVGTKPEVKELLEREVERIGLGSHVGRNISIVYGAIYEEYYAAMNQALRTTDILWSKPSELSFYTALGLPFIMAPYIGTHEKYNRNWLAHIGSGYSQDDPDHADEWLTYGLEDGQLARAALQGYLYAPSMGTYNIEKLVHTRNATAVASAVVSTKHVRNRSGHR